jgi:hypothetical protein
MLYQVAYAKNRKDETRSIVYEVELVKSSGECVTMFLVDHIGQKTWLVDVDELHASWVVAWI